MIKLIAIDIDGTLLTSDHRLTKPVHEAIAAAHRQGVQIVLCTGRPILGILPYLEALGLRGANDVAITQNGALVQATGSHKVYSHLIITLDQLKLINAFVANTRAQLTVFDEAKMYALHPYPSERVINDAKLLHTALNVINLSDISDDFLITKAMLLGDPHDISDIICHIPKHFAEEFYMVRSVPYNYEFLNRAASKGNALEALADRLHLTSHNIMAIGDAENDRSMLEYAGTAVAMGNASDEIKQLASFVTESNDNHGVAFAIQKLVLNK